ncbi:lipid-A-disaccharide synthase [Azospirillum sp. TSH7]|jgi:lipid-A-disaccharide synthase|uniref:lipid-A-disaccharide synthase n=1 Tax=unclassified Azospirillum TaxID=2630922 RepID=UPI000D616F16|nr:MULTISPECIES: lipid-A-disaccharide synthase [unclassified Azospirillum]PWC59851.1 lipid-A-disaccharide synthase [Azospirillum sp. TSH20]PWC68815.1 lipid-A-disaccharide synthase [Azospirillum sp. TSH7]
MSGPLAADDGPTLFLIAGEPSGDALGARLMAAAKRLTGGKVRFVGIGGEKMMAEGLVSLFPMAELTLFGIFELLPHLPNLIRRIDQTVAEIIRIRPDAVVGIDSPGFTVRVAKKVRAAAPAIPLIHYVAPTVWAWKPKRAAKYAAIYDHLLAVLPFEPPYFEREGLACTFVGHSVVEGGAGKGDGAGFRNRHGIASTDRVVAVLPGSRKGEVSRLLPDFRATLERLQPTHPTLVAVIPTVATVRDRVAAAIADWPVRTVLLEGDAEKYDAFTAAEAALAASGTVSLELALARLPTVIAYRLNPVTVALYRRLIRVKYVNLVNLMLDRMLVPELLQQDCRPERLATELGRLLDDPAARQAQIDGVAEVARWLGQGDTPPSERAARTILNVVAERRLNRPLEGKP